MKQRILMAALVILVFIVIHCSKKQQYPVQTRTEDAVTVFINPDYPRVNPSNVRLEEDDSFALHENGSAADFIRPHTIRLVDEVILISDWKLNRIAAYLDNGSFSYRIDGTINDQIRFQPPFFFDFLPGERVIVVDSGRDTVSVFQRGILTGQFVLPSGYHSHLHLDDEGHLYLSKLIHQETGRVMTFHQYSLDGRELLNYGRFRVDQPLLVQNEKGESVMVGSVPFAPTTSISVNREGRLFAGFSAQYQIRVYDKSGRLEMKFEKPFDPIPNPYAGEMGQPAHLPAFTRNWLFDGERLWIEVYKSSDDEGVIYDAFTSDGIYEYHLILPNRIRAINDSYCYYWVTDGLSDEKEVWTLKRARIVVEQKS